MADILYTYKNQVYVNLTNRCDCRCTFCIRTTKNAVGDATDLWFQNDPTWEEIKAAIDRFDFTGYEELVFCGYGEPTCALENLLATAQYVKEKLGIRTRLNTNGLGNLYHKQDIIPKLSKVIDRVSISLNAPTAEKYMEVTRPQFADAFSGLLAFAKESVSTFSHAQMTIVDVLPQEEILACKKLASDLGIDLKIRKFSAA